MTVQWQTHMYLVNDSMPLGRTMTRSLSGCQPIIFARLHLPNNEPHQSSGKARYALGLKTPNSRQDQNRATISHTAPY